jgi:hypothetical protein
MKIFILSFLTLIFLAVLNVNEAHARCDHSWDTASDGSRCGGRAADERPGGRP